ncbi:MAG: hypothetical protein JRI90_15815, partial [Deltaproteobacteria bacterium]|nr:hypothetical protein [Deltaproteobacteria bacterium]
MDIPLEVEEDMGISPEEKVMKAQSHSSEPAAVAHLGTGVNVILTLIFALCLSISVFAGSGVYAQGPKKILSIEAYDMLNTVPDTYLIDIRTRAEYQFVG